MGGETNSSATVNTETIGWGLFFTGGLSALATMLTSYFLGDAGLNYAEKLALTTGNATGAAACRAGRVAIETTIFNIGFGTVLISLPFIYLPNREITLYSKPEEKKFHSMDEAKLTCSFAIAKARAQQNQLNSEVCWACDQKTGIILPGFVTQELNPQLNESGKIQKQFLIARWLRRQSTTTSDSRIDTTISKIAELMSKPELWEKTDVTSVLDNLEQIYSDQKLQEYTKDPTKRNAWNNTIDLLKKWPSKLDLETDLKDKLSWFTSEVISIEAKRAVIRALLTKIRQSKSNTLTKSRYTQLTAKVQGSSYASTWREYGNDLIDRNKWREWYNNNGLQAKWGSWKTYFTETFTNSKELENDTKQDGYLDQVITLFLLFVRDILGIEDKAVGAQQDNEVGSTAYNTDVTLGYGSTGYSKRDDPQREAFVREVTSQLTYILSKDKDKIVVKETDTPRISFEINQKQVYYLAELANVFYQFMSAEMDKPRTGDQPLNDDQFKDATTKGSYIQRQEEYNLGYLRKWFVRTRSIHPIISWLFQNYNPHMSQKISLSAAYWYSYSFISDWRKYYGEGLYNLIAPVFKGLGKAGEDAWQYVKEYVWPSTPTTPS